MAFILKYEIWKRFLKSTINSCGRLLFGECPPGMSVRKRVNTIWAWLSEPDASVHKLDERRKIRLFSIVLFVLMVSVLPPSFLPVEFVFPPRAFIVLFLGLAVSYILSRTRYYRWGIWISLFFLSGFSLIPVFFLQEYNAPQITQNIMWVILPLILASVILPFRNLLAMGAVILVIILSLPVIFSVIQVADMMPVVGFILTWFSSQVIFLNHNRLLEMDRQTELWQKAAQLTTVNETLQAEIEVRTLAENRIEASLREKEVLLKEIHHRVKNNLQIISSLLNLQVQQTTDEAVLQALNGGQSRIRSMALIHEILYWSDDLTHIDFAAYVRQLSTQLCQSYHTLSCPVAVEVAADEVNLNIETAVPCGLILNELVSNALKHGFVDGRSGHIIIRLKAQNNNGIHLTVSDNGVGLPAMFDYRQSPTLGLQLVNNLVDQLEGDLTISNHQGTSISITFEDN
jgi:two-component sensor histidine kinase